MKNKRSLEDYSASNIFFIKLEDGSKIVAGGVAVLSDALLVGDCVGLFFAAGGICTGAVGGIAVGFNGSSGGGAWLQVAAASVEI